MATQDTQTAILWLGFSATMVVALAKLIMFASDAAPPPYKKPELFPFHFAVVITFNIMAIVYTTPALAYHATLITLFVISTAVYLFACFLAWKDEVNGADSDNSNSSASTDMTFDSDAPATHPMLIKAPSQPPNYWALENSPPIPPPRVPPPPGYF